jgi:Holliday junction resolvase RusA-like endonuclease
MTRPATSLRQPRGLLAAQELGGSDAVAVSQGEGGIATATDLGVEAGDAVPGTSRAFSPAPHPPLTFTVVGTPIPQGSHKAYVVNGYAKITDDNEKTKPWRQDVKHAALDARGDRPPLDGPVVVQVRFVMPRAKGHFRTGRNAHLLRDTAPPFPAGKPDVDKLQRSLLDALTAAGVFRDDAQVVRIYAEKVFADHRFGEIPCAHVAVWAAS